MSLGRRSASTDGPMNDTTHGAVADRPHEPAGGSPFHAGEQQLQSLCGVRERIEAAGRAMVRDHMPDQHRELFEKLPTLYMGTLDAEGQPWASVLCGAPGFVRTPDACTMRIGARPAADDPAAAGLRRGAAVGLLGLEPHTRRRNRMNGVVAADDAAGFGVRVVQSFGNCPKYIRAREPLLGTERAGAPAARAQGPRLDDAARALVQQCDTLFIASSSGATVEPAARAGAGVDVSHRGGRAGFVRWQREAAGDVLTLPDYAGNRLFNTLGNLLLWPHAGLLFVDWERGDLLQLAARAELQHDGPALADHPGAQRLLHLRVQRGWWRPAAMPLAWRAGALAPQFANS